MRERLEPRFAMDFPAVVSIPAGAATSRWHARVRNVSRSGMAMEVSCAVKPGDRLLVGWEGGESWATAVHCRKGPDYWLLGVALDLPFRGLSLPMGSAIQAASVLNP
jgi:hypothetical protein